MRSNLIVIPPPSFTLQPGVVQAEEPVGVQIFRPELAVERLSKGVVCRLARPREVQFHPMQPGPQVELLRDELRPVVQPDAPRPAILGGNPFQCRHLIGIAIAQPHVDRRHNELGSCASRNARDL